jgi:Skp family chaperone for outer membrane proteins
LASDPQAETEITEMMDVVRKHIGNDGGPLTTEQHEIFARTAEAYFMEGKAPSLELADAFARFKSWLTRIYRSLAGLNVKVTPEIREVFDRMLATDAEIAAAREAQQMRPLFRQSPEGMSDAAWSAYQRHSRRAAEEASQRLLDKTMAKVRRAREKWYREERKAVLREDAPSFAARYPMRSDLRQV